MVGFLLKKLKPGQKMDFKSAKKNRRDSAVGLGDSGGLLERHRILSTAV
jgi:hypothetical protein